MKEQPTSLTARPGYVIKIVQQGPQAGRHVLRAAWKDRRELQAFLDSSAEGAQVERQVALADEAVAKAKDAYLQWQLMPIEGSQEAVLQRAIERTESVRATCKDAVAQAWHALYARFAAFVPAWDLLTPDGKEIPNPEDDPDTFTQVDEMTYQWLLPNRSESLWSDIIPNARR